MRDFIVTIVLFLLFFEIVNAQSSVKGVVIHADTEIPLQGVTIILKNAKTSEIKTLTNSNGVFHLKGISKRISEEKQQLIISFKGFETQYFPILVTDKNINLGTIFLYENIQVYDDVSTIILTDDELNDDESTADNISGLLQATKDTYLRAAAFEWSSSFYRIKGLDSDNAKILINGIEMNKLYNGRPQWSNWGGLNDVLRNQDFSNGLSPSNHTFGGVLGATNMSTRASEYRQGGRISYASSNRSYTHRFMAMYATGILKNNWAIAVSASKRYANQGFTEGASYNANSFFISAENVLNQKHSINFTGIFTQNHRGKAAANTQEVYDIKGIKYNPYWGYQQRKIRNARIKRVDEPLIMLNHYWNINPKTRLQTGIAYQFGEIGNSRIDFNGGNDPSPTYYRKLPNYFLNDDYKIDHENAYKSLVNFKNDGQLNWKDLYIGNQNSKENALFAQYEDRNDDKQWSVNSILNSEISENIALTTSAFYQKLNSENFASVLDLFGAEGYLDINKFGNLGQADYQNDLLNPNRIVKKGDRFKYNYELNADVYGGFTQLQFKYHKADFFIAGTMKNTSYQRNGLYKNGIYPGDATNPEIPTSFGKSEKLNFLGYGIKAGITYKISGRHLIDFNGAYLKKAPSIRNSFANSRANNLTVNQVHQLKIAEIMPKTNALDISYILRTPFVTAKLTGFYTQITNDTDIAFYFTSADNLFVQEIVTGIKKNHFGTELGIEAQVLASFKIKAAANIGQYSYANNPNIVLASEISEDSKKAGFDTKGVKNYGKTMLKNYKIASGPQKVYSFGFEYRDPEYWFFGVTANYLSEAYVDVSPIKRTTSFISDDTQFFPEYDPNTARKLLSQEKFDSYPTLNAIGGKTWRIAKNKYIGFFASATNILHKEYKTGGYEQGRTANYQLENNDNANQTPSFSSKYWYGRGATYFLNVNYRF
ncbi:carboxypeptidase-like regulatory domain-containing protein [Tenacibaculum piscium]|uniref:carboxypeptidase-like regulatory domain-containing protein n=1 Tax=Tenacibaculum piscium TaxID=1458515 RepID=UPI001F348169|nr:carboxypeptidase-like regulatory domain-containing protein [Tenacibaculum piscium]